MKQQQAGNQRVDKKEVTTIFLEKGEEGRVEEETVKELLLEETEYFLPLLPREDKKEWNEGLVMKWLAGKYRPVFPIEKEAYAWLYAKLHAATEIPPSAVVRIVIIKDISSRDREEMKKKPQILGSFVQENKKIELMAEREKGEDVFKEMNVLHIGFFGQETEIEKTIKFFNINPCSFETIKENCSQHLYPPTEFKKRQWIIAPGGSPSADATEVVSPQNNKKEKVDLYTPSRVLKKSKQDKKKKPFSHSHPPASLAKKEKKKFAQTSHSQNKGKKRQQTQAREATTEGDRLDTLDSFIVPSNDSNLSTNKTTGHTVGKDEKGKKKGNAGSLNAAREDKRQGKEKEKEKEKEEDKWLLSEDTSINTYRSDQGGADAPDEESAVGRRRFVFVGPPEAPFLRWALRNQMVDKFFSTYWFLESLPSGLIKSFQHRLHYFFRAGAMPVNHSAFLRTRMFFLQGAYWITDVVWPVSFAALLAHDFFLYSHDALGQTAWSEMVGGYAENPDLWSTRFSDLQPDDPYYWVGPAGFIALPFLVGLLNTVIRRRGERGATPKSTRNTLEYRSILRDWVTALIPSVLFGPFQRPLSRARFEILYNRKLEEKNSESDEEANAEDNKEERDAYFRVVDVLVNNHSGPARLQAMAVLATIADSLSKANLQSANITDDNEFTRLKEKAEITLVHLIISPYDFITRLYRWHLLASIGKPQHQKDKFLAGVWAGVALIAWASVLFAKFRGGQMVYNAVRHAVDFFTASPLLPLCDVNQPRRAYLSTFAEDVCTVCGHWPQMFAGDVFDAQSCANGLFQITRSPDEFIDSLHYLSHFSNWTVADVSHQDWTGWTDEQFDGFLNALAESPQLTTLNLARSAASTHGISEAKAASLSRFIQRMHLTHVSLANQPLGSTQVQILVPGFSNSTVVDLNLSYCVTEGSTLLPLIDTLPSMRYCQSVNLSGNHFGNTEVERLCAVGPHTAIILLDLQDSPDIGQAGFSTLGQTLPHWPLIEFRVSNVDLTYVDTEPFWQGVGNSTLIECHVVACHLTDDQLLVAAPYLLRSNLTTFNVSDNPAITDTGFVGSLYVLRGSKIAHYVFSKVAITNQGLRSVSTFWSELEAIESIDLSGCRFDASGFSLFVSAHHPSKFQMLRATDNSLTDDIAPALNEWIADRNSTLRMLDLSRNWLSDTLGVPMGESLRTSPLEKLILTGNRFTGQTIAVIGRALSHHKLIHIDLSENPISGNPLTNITSFARALADSAVETLLLRNALSGDDLNVLFSHLITPMPLPPKSALPSTSVRQDFAKANATTPIQRLDVRGPITAQQATLGCLVRYPSRIADFQMQQLNGSVDVITCDFPSSASRLPQGIGLEIYRFLQERVNHIRTWFSQPSETTEELSERFYLDSDERVIIEELTEADVSVEAEEMEHLLSSLASRTRRWTEESSRHQPNTFFLPAQTTHNQLRNRPLALPSTGIVAPTSTASGSTMALGLLVGGGTVLILLGGFLLVALLIQLVQKLRSTDNNTNDMEVIPEESLVGQGYGFFDDSADVAGNIHQPALPLPTDSHWQSLYKRS